MKRDDWMLFTLVFMTGLAIGIYVYVAAFKPIYAPEDLSGVESEASEWSIIGKRRGGEHQNGFIHPSFRVLGDGSYTYLMGGEGDNALTPREGKLSKRMVRALKVTEEDLVIYSRSISRQCLTSRGEYEYEYRVVYEGESYLLDTCYTALGHSSDLAEALDNVWMYLSDGTVTERTVDTPSEWLENFLYEALHGEEKPVKK